MTVSEGVVLKILIRHSSGSKVNKTEPFTLEGPRDIYLGRDPSCTIVYDTPHDETVSRKHAVVRASGDVSPRFTIEDLGSSNGTFLNKRRIQGQSELFPDDIVSLGLNGPSFTFDLDPRPSHLLARTKMFDATSPATTRVLTAAEAASVAETAADLKALKRSTIISATQEPATGKIGIGRDTMLHEIAKERGATNQKWLSALAATAVFILIAGIGGGYLFWKQTKDANSQQASLVRVKQEAEFVAEQAKRETEALRKDAESKDVETAASIRRQFGMTPLDIVRKYGAATAFVEAQWRTYDQNTGRPIFLKVYPYQGKKYPLYLKFSDGHIVPWFTLDDEGRSNIPIENNVSGTAFVVSDQGFLLTSKHLAAAWRVPFFNNDAFEHTGVLAEPTGYRNKKIKWSLINITDNTYDLHTWFPDNGGILFDAKSLAIVGEGQFPDLTSNQRRNFTSRNDSITVKFANNRLDMNASLVRYSNESDVALIRVETPQALNKMDMDDSASTSPGERVTVLGFPAISTRTFAISQTTTSDGSRSNRDFVPQPYVTEGIVALMSNRSLTERGITMAADEGDIMQLTINSTGKGNSGGPVFNSAGKVIGIFTWIISAGNAQGSGAVPIKYGIELFKSQ